MLANQPVVVQPSTPPPPVVTPTPPESKSVTSPAVVAVPVVPLVVPAIAPAKAAAAKPAKVKSRPTPIPDLKSDNEQLQNENQALRGEITHYDTVEISAENIWRLLKSGNIQSAFFLLNKRQKLSLSAMSMVPYGDRFPLTGDQGKELVRRRALLTLEDFEKSIATHLASRAGQTKLDSSDNSALKPSKLQEEKEFSAVELSGEFIAAQKKSFELWNEIFDETEENFSLFFDEKTQAAEIKQQKDAIASNLYKLAQAQGYECVTVPDDGNCQFHAVAAQLGLLKDDLILKGYGGLATLTHEDLRKRAVSVITRNKKDFSGFIIGENIDSYLARMSKDKEWGDQYTLLALAKALNVNIAVMHADGNTISFPDPLNASALTTIHIGYNGYNHYYSLKPNVLPAVVPYPDLLMTETKDCQKRLDEGIEDLLSAWQNDKLQNAQAKLALDDAAVSKLVTLLDDNKLTDNRKRLQGQLDAHFDWQKDAIFDAWKTLKQGKDIAHRDEKADEKDSASADKELIFPVVFKNQGIAKKDGKQSSADHKSENGYEPIDLVLLDKYILDKMRHNWMTHFDDYDVARQLKINKQAIVLELWRTKDADLSPAIEIELHEAMEEKLNDLFKKSSLENKDDLNSPRHSANLLHPVYKKLVEKRDQQFKKAKLKRGEIIASEAAAHAAVKELVEEWCQKPQEKSLENALGTIALQLPLDKILKGDLHTKVADKAVVVLLKQYQEQSLDFDMLSVANVCFNNIIIARKGEVAEKRNGLRMLLNDWKHGRLNESDTAFITEQLTAEWREKQQQLRAAYDPNVELEKLRVQVKELSSTPKTTAVTGEESSESSAAVLSPETEPGAGAIGLTKATPSQAQLLSQQSMRAEERRRQSKNEQPVIHPPATSAGNKPPDTQVTAQNKK